MTSDGDRERRDIKKLVQVGRAKRKKLVGYGSLKNSRKFCLKIPFVSQPILYAYYTNRSCCVIGFFCFFFFFFIVLVSFLFKEEKKVDESGQGSS
jgi:hypothetical protein